MSAMASPSQGRMVSDVTSVVKITFGTSFSGCHHFKKVEDSGESCWKAVYPVFIGPAVASGRQVGTLAVLKETRLLPSNIAGLCNALFWTNIC